MMIIQVRIYIRILTSSPAFHQSFTKTIQLQSCMQDASLMSRYFGSRPQTNALPPPYMHASPRKFVTGVVKVLIWLKGTGKLRVHIWSKISVLREVPMSGCIYNFCSRTEDGWFAGTGSVNIFACSMLLNVS